MSSSDPRYRPPSRLRGLPAYALAIGVTLLAGLLTMTTWPFFGLAPFAPFFLAVYISARYGSRRAGLVAIAGAVLIATTLGPPNAVQFTWIPTSIFTGIALLANSLISGRTEALEAMQASEARAIRALEETTATEAKLRQAQKMEAVGHLVAGVAHNFNNLLTISMGYTDLLLQDATDEMKPHLAEIRQATERGAKLTRQLLAITRKRDAALTYVDLNQPLAELETLIVPLMREDIRVSIQPASAPVVVVIDPQDIEQILLNLVVNARDALPNGGTIRVEAARVSVTASDVPAAYPATPGEFVRLTVRDNGVGMSADVQAHLFEPFFTTKDVDKGTGLGLAFTFGVVRGARGFITVNSAVGAGTSVAIHLPLAQAAPTADRATTGPSKTAIVRQARILVVEDDPQVRSVAVRILANAGYSVAEAGSAAEAFDYFVRDSSIALLLTDVVMPGLRGPALARQLQKAHPQLRVLVMSGYHDVAPGEAEEFPRIDKPFTSADLLEAVRTALR